VAAKCDYEGHFVLIDERPEQNGQELGFHHRKTKAVLDSLMRPTRLTISTEQFHDFYNALGVDLADIDIDKAWYALSKSMGVRHEGAGLPEMAFEQEYLKKIGHQSVNMRGEWVFLPLQILVPLKKI
jgi:hypothetical protein